MTREEAIHIVETTKYYSEKNYPEFREALSILVPELYESEDEKIYNEIMEFFKMNEKRCIVDNSYTRWITWLEKQKEQKPVEWSEEDEKMLSDISWAIRYCTYDDKKKKRVHDWFVNHLKSLRPQPKPELSEDIKRTLDDVSQVLIMLNYKETALNYKQAIEQLISMLPQKKEDLPRWKPSEEQMDSLQRAIELAEHEREYALQEELVEIVEQLKAL